MAVEDQIEWTRSLGEGRLLVMKRTPAGHRAVLAGFCGIGSSQAAAIDNLLVHMRDYGVASDDFERALAPGGHLHEKLRQIEQLVDHLTGEKS